ncbi:MAG: hypothetical protein U9Q04_06180 [Campylobacterota bacterium]|nr:hypothetical protein [Campylobacterota bacterium]
MNSSIESIDTLTHEIEKIFDKRGGVFSVEFEDQTLWVKKAQKSGSNAFHHLFYKLIKNRLLIPAQTQSGIESVMFEAHKIKEIKKQFDNVPTVIYSCEEYMVLSDTGINLRALIDKKEKSDDEIKTILYEALKLLTQLHNLGFYHGGSQIKNFTYKDDKISIIDFEEKFSTSEAISDLQFRDLFLFLISIARVDLNIDFKDFITFYIDLTGHEDFKQKFEKVIKDLRFVLWLLNKEVVLKKMDKDTKSVYKLLTQIKF